MAVQNTSLCMGSDYRIALLCNAYSTSTELFTRPMAVLVESILGTQKVNIFNNFTIFSRKVYEHIRCNNRYLLFISSINLYV
jgi:aconitase B